MSTKEATAIKEPSVKQLVDELVEAGSRNVGYYHLDYQKEKTNAITMATIGTIFTLLSGLSIKNINDDLNAQKAFIPANSVKDITTGHKNKKLSEVKAEAIDYLAPQTITYSAKPVYSKDGVYFTPPVNAKGHADFITTKQFNNAVTKDLKNAVIKDLIFTAIAVTGVGLTSFMAGGAYLCMRENQHDIKLLHQDLIDTTKVQPLNPTPAGPGQHG